MPDWKSAIEATGLKASPAQHGGGRPASGRPSRDAPPSPFPTDYPKYFDEHRHLNVDYVDTLAEKIARSFADGGLTQTQLRDFYLHARRQLDALAYRPFEDVVIQIKKMRSVAADRAGRKSNPLPRVFKEFIDRNLEAVQDNQSYQKGFMEHFQAIVGFCGGLLRENR